MLGEEKYMMILEHLFVPENKEAPKNYGNVSKRHKKQLEWGSHRPILE